MRARRVEAQVKAGGRVLEPHRRKLAGLSLLTAAASSAAAVLARNRKKTDVTTSAAEADADDVAPAAEMSDRQEMASTGADADVNGQVRTT
jgi:hypothetical protein